MTHAFSIPKYQTSNAYAKRGIIIYALILISFNFFAQIQNNSKNPATIEQQMKFLEYDFDGFTENKGQMADQAGNPVPNVLFKTNIDGTDLYVTNKGITYVFLKPIEETNGDVTNENILQQHDGQPVKYEWVRVDMNLQDAHISPYNIIKENVFPKGRMDYYLGHCPEGVFDVKTYGKITIKDVYPGIDWVFHSNSSQGIKYDFIVHPGANPNKIKMQYEGMGDIKPGENSSFIKIATPLGELIEGELLSFQEEGTKPVSSSYLIQQKTISFNIGNYNNNVDLVIDPPLKLHWTTYYGGSDAEGGRAITLDKQENIFITGWVSSTNFPVLNAYQGTISSGTVDAFVAKFDRNGVHQWSTYYGGNNDDRGEGIATDNAGNVYVTGGTRSSNFPLQNWGTAYNQAPNMGASPYFDIMILKFGPTGARLWATCYGGENGDKGMAITTDVNDNIYITGYAGCNNFPTTNPAGGAYFNNVYGGGDCTDYYVGGDACILKFNAAGACVWATLFGGDAVDAGRDIKISPLSGNIFITGFAKSTDIPRLNPLGGAYYQPTMGGVGLAYGDVFIAEFSGTNYSLVWSTYYGGNFGDVGEGIDISPNGDIFVVGSTSSTNFPVQNLAGAYYQGTYTGPTASPFHSLGDMFILKFDNTRACRWATYFGGSRPDAATDVTLDKCGNIYITGRTLSTIFPVFNPGPGDYYYDPTFNGGSIGWGDAVIMAFDVNGARQWVTYYGGPGDNDAVWESVVNWKGKAFIIGEMSGGGVGVNPGGGAYYDATYNGGGGDVYVLSFEPLLKPTTAPATHVSCYGGNDGTAIATPTGGVAGITYTWSTTPVQTTQTATGLSAGIYTVTVSDSYCAKDTLSVLITEPAKLVAFIPSQTNILCYGEPTGKASAGALGGTGAYTYQWAPGGQITQTISNIPAGTITVTITDNNGCSAQKSATLTEPFALTANITAQTDILCNGDNTGSITVTAGNGTAPYIYSWSVPTQTGATVSNLTAAGYSVTVTDHNGCSIQVNTVLTQPDVLTINLSSTPDHCLLADGTATIVAGGGTFIYTYNWSNGTNTPGISNLPAGIYSATVTDSNGCSLTNSISVNPEQADVLQFVSKNNTSCHNECDGTVTLQLSGTSNGPYTYNWNSSTPQTELTATGLCAGLYTCTVTDANSCKDTIQITISQPLPLTASINATSTSCFGSNDASAIIQQAGGTSPYTYVWDNGETSAATSGIPAGVFSCTITDNNNCTTITSTNITEPQQLIVNINSPFTICLGQSANLTSSISGGTAGYTYNWSNGAITPNTTVSPRGETNYSIIVNDANGCSAITQTTVSIYTLQEPSLSYDKTPGCGPLCITFTNTTPNSISATWDFGDGSPPSQSNTNNFHCYDTTGQYGINLTVTDGNGCTSNALFSDWIIVYPNPVASFYSTPQPASILSPTVYFTDLSNRTTAWQWSFGDVTNASSSDQNPNYTYSDTGSYVVQLVVTNEFGCKDSIEKEIKVNPDFVIYVPNTFTPNGDKINDIFIPMGVGINSDHYELLIYDRWGNIIFKSANPEIGWDGKIPGGQFAQQDTYVWRLALRDVIGKTHSYVGHINLIK